MASLQVLDSLKRPQKRCVPRNGRQMLDAYRISVIGVDLVENCSRQSRNERRRRLRRSDRLLLDDRAKRFAKVLRMLIHLFVNVVAVNFDMQRPTDNCCSWAESHYVIDGVGDVTGCVRLAWRTLGDVMHGEQLSQQCINEAYECCVQKVQQNIGTPPSVHYIFTQFLCSPTKNSHKILPRFYTT